jgi:hypothetical protein
MITLGHMPPVGRIYENAENVWPRGDLATCLPIFGSRNKGLSSRTKTNYNQTLWVGVGFSSEISLIFTSIPPSVWFYSFHTRCWEVFQTENNLGESTNTQEFCDSFPFGTTCGKACVSV